MYAYTQTHTTRYGRLILQSQLYVILMLSKTCGNKQLMHDITFLTFYSIASQHDKFLFLSAEVIS